MIQQIKEFGQLIQSLFPAAKLYLEELPSGNVWLDVNFTSFTLEMEYNPQQGFGVSIINAESTPFTPHDDTFDTFEEAKDHILKCLDSLTDR